MAVHIDASIVEESNVFRPEPLFHNRRRLEEAGPGQFTVSVHDAMTREPGSNGGIHRPSDGTRRRPRAYIFSDVAVCRHRPAGDFRDDLPDALVKGV